MARMSRPPQHDGGFSLVELLVAMGLTLLVTASVIGLTGPAQQSFPLEMERVDLQQRLRVGVDTLARDLRQAGAGAYQGDRTSVLGPLSGPIPSVLPLRRGRRRPDSPDTFRADTVTLLRVNPGATQTTIAQPLPARGATVRVNLDLGCPVGDPACGFRAGMMVLAFEEGGSNDLFTVLSVAGSDLTLQHNGPDTSFVYPAGTTRIVDATSRTYYAKAEPDTETFQLVQYDGAGGADVPVVDHLVGLSFEYLVDPQPPLMRQPVTATTGPWTTYGPKPPLPGVRTTSYPPGENCVFSSDGSPTPTPRLAVLGGGTPSLVRLDGAQFTDGPWCPDSSHANRFDADLLRVRSLIVTLRVESAVAAFRGPAGPLFVRGGSSAGGRHFLPDQEVRFEVALRNLAGGR